MTPHSHWIRNYTPFRTPIRLANDLIVYSAGIGSVRFVPTIRGKKMRVVEFTRVLHVPDLRTNLLSILYLTRHKQFTVVIDAHEMTFKRDNTLLFTAQINENNAAFLDGATDANSESASYISTLPIDISLWHRRLAHHDYNSVRGMISKNLVTGIDIKSNQAPDPVCEPCLSGKMNANPFPSSTTRASKPLELIHTDLHGPFKVRTVSGYRYWITFIDDFTRFRAVMFLKSKDQAFNAFQRYKAYAENHLGAKIQCMRIDKGGEYMSNQFINYMLDHGITRQYTVRARPQQNGVAERANRTIEKNVVAIPAESRLPPSFLGQAVAAYVHIWNRCSTTSLTSKTPYELWHRKKPDVSHLRVWGCTAYVHVQKDKRTGIGSHMEKCVFVGYPDGYKGWTFYNPTTKRTVISVTNISVKSSSDSSITSPYLPVISRTFPSFPHLLDESPYFHHSARPLRISPAALCFCQPSLFSLLSPFNCSRSRHYYSIITPASYSSFVITQPLSNLTNLPLLVIFTIFII